MKAVITNIARPSGGTVEITVDIYGGDRDNELIDNLTVIGRPEEIETRIIEIMRELQNIRTAIEEFTIGQEFIIA